MFRLGLKKSRNPFRTFIFRDEESLCISTWGRRFRTYIHTYLLSLKRKTLYAFSIRSSRKKAKKKKKRNLRNMQHTYGQVSLPLLPLSNTNFQIWLKCMETWSSLKSLSSFLHQWRSSRLRFQRRKHPYRSSRGETRLVIRHFLYFVLSKTRRKKKRKRKKKEQTFYLPSSVYTFSCSHKKAVWSVKNLTTNIFRIDKTIVIFIVMESIRRMRGWLTS